MSLIRLFLEKGRIMVDAVRNILSNLFLQPNELRRLVQSLLYMTAMELHCLSQKKK